MKFRALVGGAKVLILPQISVETACLDRLSTAKRDRYQSAADDPVNTADLTVKLPVRWAAQGQFGDRPFGERSRTSWENWQLLRSATATEWIGGREKLQPRTQSADKTANLR